MTTRLILFLIVLSLSGPAGAVVIADSQGEFSGVQGQDGWSYGLFDAGGVPGVPLPFMVADFAAFDTFTGATWEASDAQVGGNNNDFLSLNVEGGHPTGIGPDLQDSVIWAVRRYTSDVVGDALLAFDVRKLNVSNARGGGITARIFIDGTEVFTQLIDNLDDVGVQQVMPVTLALGTIIDLVIDPTGVIPGAGSDGVFSARADGSHFSAVIRAASAAEPTVLPLLLIGLMGCFAVRVSRRHSDFISNDR